MTRLPLGPGRKRTFRRLQGAIKGHRFLTWSVDASSLPVRLIVGSVRDRNDLGFGDHCFVGGGERLFWAGTAAGMPIGPGLRP